MDYPSATKVNIGDALLYKSEPHKVMRIEKGKIQKEGKTFVVYYFYLDKIPSAVIHSDPEVKIMDATHSAQDRPVAVSLGKRPPRRKEPSLTEQAQAVQADIARQRQNLGQARRWGNTAEMQQICEELIRLRVEFCQLIRPRSKPELNQLEERFREAIYRESTHSGNYKKWCWVCSADVESTSNDRCGCRWLICACGACQCPDFWDGSKGWQAECQEQIDRLGRELYEVLVKERQRRLRTSSLRSSDYLPISADDLPF